MVVQLTGVIAGIGWTAVVTFILLKVVNAIMTLRVDEEEEQRGLDLVLHDERGYDL